MKAFGKAACHIHFVGIGGVGMSGIAEVLLTLGHRVSGSDITETGVSRRLSALGANITYGHDAGVIHDGLSVVVISSAVKYSNPEVLRARELRSVNASGGRAASDSPASRARARATLTAS